MTNPALLDLRRQADEQRDAIARDVDLVTDRVSPSRVADRQKAKVRQSVGSVRESLFGTSDRHRLASDHDDSLRDRASHALDRANEATPDSVGEFTEGNPLAAGLIGLGIGLLAATLLPQSREEQRIADKAQDTLDNAAGELARAGQQTAEAIKPAVTDAVDEVKTSAHESVESVKTDAQNAATDVKDTAITATKDVQATT